MHIMAKLAIITANVLDPICIAVLILHAPALLGTLGILLNKCAVQAVQVAHQSVRQIKNAIPLVTVRAQWDIPPPKMFYVMYVR